VTAGVQGGWDKKFDVWDTFIVGGSPDIISVTPDTPYKTLKDLIEAAKKNPNGIKAAASGAGSIHHLNLLAVEKVPAPTSISFPIKAPPPARMRP
jgi:tripartite-type tricarboxylate transporter receptor subunit TctC